MELELPAPGAFACLYVSPHPGLAVRSCASRISWERQRGLEVLVVVLFGDEVGMLPPGARGMACALPNAARRGREPASPRAQVEDRGAEDEDALARAAVLLDALARRSGARNVYAPLGLGLQIDHILSHEAALRAFHADSGRNVLLYEEWPHASVPGAVRMRLANMGAQLPPGAAAPRRAGLLRYVLGLLRRERERGGLGEIIATSRAVARQWRTARAWRPQRAFGPRLQPVEHPVAPEGSERFWLLLPERDPGGAAIASARLRDGPGAPE